VDCRYHLEKEHSLHEDYEVTTDVLGQGLCGSVVVARGRQDDRRYAVKTLKKQGAPYNKALQFVAEVEIHLSMDHPNIAQVKDVYESEAAISMVTECCEGGELYASLQEKSVYGNAEAAEVTRQMMGVVHHLHERRIVHRDLKLENFLFQEKNPHEHMAQYIQNMQDSQHRSNSLSTDAPQLTLIDFGFARVWDPSKLMVTACGSAEYVSPDVLSGRGYTNKADLWSIGVIVWMLLTGYPPFHGGKKEMMMKIKAGKPDWSHQSRWKNVTQDARDFIEKLLVKESSDRMDASAALRHPWLTTTLQRPYFSLTSEGTVLSMQRYAAGSKLRHAALQLLVRQLDWAETRKLRAAFFSMDKNGKGWISAQDLQSAMEDLEQTSNELPFQLAAAGLENAEELFGALDTNGDQRIYYSEFLAATVQIGATEHKSALKASFARLDADGSGSVGASDLRRTLGRTFEGADVAELLSSVSAQSGELGYREFVEAVTGGTSVEEVDVISPRKNRFGYPLIFSAVSV
jgi:calcium-dependent protein kinase